MLEREMSGWTYGNLIGGHVCLCLACLLLGEFMFEDFSCLEKARESERK